MVILLSSFLFIKTVFDAMSSAERPSGLVLAVVEASRCGLQSRTLGVNYLHVDSACIIFRIVLILINFK